MRTEPLAVLAADRFQRDRQQHLLTQDIFEQKPFALVIPNLGFRGSALQAFRFLLDDYGFEVVETSPISARFTNDEMFVDVSHWPTFPMNSILVGRLASEETAMSGFSLDDFAYVAGHGVLFDYERFDLLDPAGISAFLQTAASLVRSHGSPLLSGDPEAFREFQNKADERERSYIEMMERQHSAQH